MAKNRKEKSGQPGQEEAPEEVVSQEEQPQEGEVVEEIPQEEQPDPAAELEAQLSAERDKYLRLAAEYDNYRKRSLKEREAIFSDVRGDTIVKLLPVYDNLQRALAQKCSDEAFYKGVEMTMNQLRELLGTMGVTEIAAVGEKFDPAIHNAVLQMESADHEEGMILEELKKGFMLGDKVLRHSDVIVAK
ncbi:MAG: nucleotide exchange factor GrpE [Oscillospiraceae bacterium]|nr:nucleotide exchange factor GrpE [Oscillospiraceae bacterium]